jgi:hypothetical protein
MPLYFWLTMSDFLGGMLPRTNHQNDLVDFCQAIKHKAHSLFDNRY